MLLKLKNFSILIAKHNIPQSLTEYFFIFYKKKKKAYSIMLNHYYFTTAYFLINTIKYAIGMCYLSIILLLYKCRFQRNFDKLN